MIITTKFKLNDLVQLQISKGLGWGVGVVTGIYITIEKEDETVIDYMVHFDWHPDYPKEVSQETEVAEFNLLPYIPKRSTQI